MLVRAVDSPGQEYVIFTARVRLADLCGVTGDSRLIAVRVMRVLGNPLIKGTFWLDDVQLAAGATAGKID